MALDQSTSKRPWTPLVRSHRTAVANVATGSLLVTLAALLAAPMWLAGILVFVTAGLALLLVED